MKSKNDFIKLVDGNNLQYKPIYLAFGYVEDVTKYEESKIKIGNKIYAETKEVVYLKRDYRMKNYDKLVSLQHEYFSLAEKPKKPKKINKFLCFILLLLGIIPGLIYIASKKRNKHKIENNRERMNEILDIAKKLLEE